jgi:tetratricopeptide (TPR) repeat protein
VDAAQQGGDDGLAANLLSSLSYQIANVGRPEDALLLARSAVKGAAGVTPAVRALLLERVAWAAARSGDADAAARTLDAVDDAFEDRQAGDGEPEWTYWLDRLEIDTMAARVAVELGRPEQAAGLLVPVLESYDGSHARESALYSAFLAEAYARAGELDRARDALERARGFATLVHSQRADDRVRQVEGLIAS